MAKNAGPTPAVRAATMISGTGRAASGRAVASAAARPTGVAIAATANTTPWAMS